MGAKLVIDLTKCKLQGESEVRCSYKHHPENKGIDALLEISDSLGKTPPQVALNWLLQQPGVTAPIFGARTVEQLEDNLGSVGWALSADELAKLSAASDIPLPSPYSFISRYTRPREGD